MVSVVSDLLSEWHIAQSQPETKSPRLSSRASSANFFIGESLLIEFRGVGISGGPVHPDVEDPLPRAFYLRKPVPHADRTDAGCPDWMPAINSPVNGSFAAARS